MGRVAIGRLHLESLDEMVEAIPLLQARLGQRAADLWKDAYEKKKAIDKAESMAFDRISVIDSKGKSPTVAFVDRALELDPQVQQAHLRYAQVECERRKVEAMIEALKSQRTFIPGLQGKANFILQNGG